MRVAIHQPLYLPWMGYFHKMAHCDLMVTLDTVQFHERMYQRRNRIKTPGGWMWLSIPVLGSRRQLVKEALINNNQPWRERHWKSIYANYAGAPFAADYLPGLRAMFDRDWQWLVDLDEALIKLLASYLGINTSMVRASELEVEGLGTELLLNICNAVGARRYFSGISGRKYLQPELFDKAGIALEYQEFLHPVYPQRFGPFRPYMSVIDLLFNCGPDGSRFVTAKE
ncbi:MAG: WbqC family protein [Bacillota bacterium]